MKHLFTRRNIIILLIVLSVSTIGLVSFYGYNEYMYRKIGVCFSENNLKLAENYIDTISQSYKDIAKIKTLISTVNNHNAEKKPDAERTLSRLKGLKGFQNENVNLYYNTFLFEIFQGINEDKIKTHLNQSSSTVTVTTTENASLSADTISAETASVSNEHITVTVYYVENSEVYHISSECRSLARSSNVLTGPVPEGRRACKICAEG